MRNQSAAVTTLVIRLPARQEAAEAFDRDLDSILRLHGCSVWARTPDDEIRLCQLLELEVGAERTAELRAQVAKMVKPRSARRRV